MFDCHVCGKPTTDLTDPDYVGDHHLRCDHCGAESFVTDVNAEASRLRLEEAWREMQERGEA